MPYMISTNIFSRISGRVLWSLVSKSPTQNCRIRRDFFGSHNRRKRRVGSRETSSDWPVAVCLLAVPSPCISVSLKLNREGWGIPSLYLCIWMFRALEKGLLLENLSDTWEKTFPVNVSSPPARLLFFSLQTVWNSVNFPLCLRDWKPKFILNPLSRD